MQSLVKIAMQMQKQTATVSLLVQYNVTVSSYIVHIVLETKYTIGILVYKQGASMGPFSWTFSSDREYCSSSLTLPDCTTQYRIQAY